MDSPADPGQKLDLLARELNEAREQQAAISDILRVMSESPGDVTPVFQSVARHAARICEASFADIIVVDAGMIRNAANVGALGPHLPGQAIALDRTTFMGRSICDKQTLHVPDLQSPDLDFPLGRQLAIQASARTALAVPLIREGRALGTILVRRTEIRPFEDKHIALLKTFADQAAIAIENARLLNELRQRTDDLTESLEQQTAISDVLRVISSSPGDVKPVFDTVARHAAQICEAEIVDILTIENGVLVYAANFGEFGRMSVGETAQIDRGHVMGRSIIDKRPVHVADLLAPDHDFPLGRAYARRLGHRSILCVPLLREDRALGTILVRRAEVRAFEDKNIELLKTFADQAAIAIENARLLNELHQRTNDLTESLEQQTATAEILRVISSSPTDVQPVFDTIARNFNALCGSMIGSIFTIDGELVRFAGAHGFAPNQFAAVQAKYPVRLDDESVISVRAIRARAPVHIHDAMADSNYDHSHAATGAWRRMLAVPMLRDGVPLGSIVAAWAEEGAIPKQHEDLLKVFADQAVIAIENVRLFNELRQRTDDLSESLEQQTAVGDVLRVISSSLGDLEPVFHAILENATRICGAGFSVLHLPEGDGFRRAADYNVPPAYTEFRRQNPVLRGGPHSVWSRVVQTKQPVHIEDAKADQAYTDRDPVRLALVDVLKARTVLGVPMLKDGEVTGSITLYRGEVHPFTDKQIELVQNFAAQAVIAIENARLLSEVRQQANLLEAQSQELRTLNQGLEQRVDEQVGEIERMGRLRRFLPPQVADLIVSSGAEKQLESHRREITALFCDLRGFTGFSETSDPEDVMALLREYHRAIGEIIFRHGGTLERFAGDGVMVIFNDPVPLPNPALSAVQMALEMRAAIGALIEKWSRLGHELGFGIGIAHGYATLGTIGFEGRFDYAAIGTVSNVASRLCDEAQPGQILVSPRVLLAVENAVAVEPVREMALKGIRRPMLVHNVVGATA